MQNLISNSNYLMSSKDNDEERAIHPNSDNTEIMISDKADEVIRKTFSVTFSGYQIGLETSMKGNDSIFDNYEEINYPSEKDN